MSFVLVTGGTGEVALGVLPYLEREFRLHLFAPEPPGQDPRRIQGDVLDWKTLAQAMRGADAVLHLAVASGHSGSYEDDTFNDCRFDVNVKGTHHVFETARRCGVRRIVYVSSLMVVWGYGGTRLVPGDAAPRPVGTYALTKALGEEIARHYAASQEMGVITVRIAAPFDPTDPDLCHKPLRPQQVPFPDMAQAFARALTVPLTQYEVVTIVGESSRRAWDLDPARRVLGYVPQYRLDDLGVTFADTCDVRPL
jgi:uronate dehydrogenase